MNGSFKTVRHNTNRATPFVHCLLSIPFHLDLPYFSILFPLPAAAVRIGGDRIERGPYRLQSSTALALSVQGRSRRLKGDGARGRPMVARLSMAGCGAWRRQLYSPCTDHKLGSSAAWQRGPHRLRGSTSTNLFSLCAPVVGSAESRRRSSACLAMAPGSSASTSIGPRPRIIMMLELGEVVPSSVTSQIAHAKKGRKMELHDVQLESLCIARFERMDHPTSERYIPLIV